MWGYGRVSITGVDLSQILGGQSNKLGGKVVKSDKCMGVSQLLGERARAASLSLRLYMASMAS